MTKFTSSSYSLVENKLIKVFVVDDQNFICLLVKKILDVTENIDCVGIAHEGEEAISQLRHLLEVDVILVDLEMPGLDSAEFIRRVSHEFPGVGVLVYSSHQSQEHLSKALGAGAKGYLLKGCSDDELTDGIMAISKGHSQFSPDLLPLLTSSSSFTVASVKNDEPEDEDLWSLATQERIASLPRVSLRALLFLFLLVIGIVIPWAVFFKLPIITEAKGKLEPSGKVFNLDAPLSGVITQVNIKSGQQVRANQKLLNVDKVATQNQIKRVQGQIKTQQKRLMVLKQIQHQKQEELPVLQSQIKSQNAGQQSDVDSKKLQIEIKTLDWSKAKSRLSAAKQKAERYQKAQLEGALSQDLLANIKQIEKEESQNVIQARIEIVEAEYSYQQSLNTLNALVSANGIKVAQAEKEVKELKSEIAAVSQEIRQLQISTRDLKYQLNQRTIRSPTNGIVFDLTVAKPGSVVQQGEQLVTIAPQNSRPIFRGEIKSKDSGFLKTAMIAKIKLDSYSWRKFGAISGKVTWISPTTYVNQDNQEVYQVEIELESNNMPKIDLFYGQTGKAEITVKKKRIINFWLN